MPDKKSTESTVLSKQARKTVERKTKRAVRSMNTGVLMISLLFFVVGVALGVYAAMAMTENDCFELNGEKEISVSVGTPYVYHEDGAKIVSIGRDISDRLRVKTELVSDGQGGYVVDTDSPGVYTIVYTVDDIKFGRIQKIRTIRVVGGEA